eukprot:s747_g13.t1
MHGGQIDLIQKASSTEDIDQVVDLGNGGVFIQGFDSFYEVSLMRLDDGLGQVRSFVVMDFTSGLGPSRIVQAQFDLFCPFFIFEVLVGKWYLFVWCSSTGSFVRSTIPVASGPGV